MIIDNGDNDDEDGYELMTDYKLISKYIIY